MLARSAPLINPGLSSERVRRKVSETQTLARIDTIDLLRGIVMVIMLLDHTRDFAHAYSLRFDPTDPQHTTPLIFFTRWITHFCAPVFVFLAGTAVYLQRLRGKRPEVLARFLVLRGLWLILIELTVIRLGLGFNVSLSVVAVLQVIWAIGVSMIVLAAFVRFPTVVAGLLGTIMIVAHHGLDLIRIEPWQGPGSAIPSVGEKLFMLLHQAGAFPIAGPGSPVLFVLYPLIPWIGVMMAGYAFGAMYTMEPKERYRRMAQVGMALTAIFLVLRAVDVYGDPHPWMEEQTPLIMSMSFFNVTKYPPSFLYLCMTLGPALLLLAWMERQTLTKGLGVIRERGWMARTLMMFGRVPLFYYILQWYVAHTLAIVAGLIAGQSVAHLFHALSFRPNTERVGFSLPVVYGLWVIGVVLLYFPCSWYERVKSARRHWWLRYL